MKLITFVLVVALVSLSACYKCKQPDCSDLPPGGDYPGEPPMRVRDGGTDGR